MGKIGQKIVRLKSEYDFGNSMKFPAGTEIEIVNDVVYMGGQPVDFRWQKMIFDWVNNNPNLFTEDFRRF